MESSKPRHTCVKFGTGIVSGIFNDYRCNCKQGEVSPALEC